MRATKENQRYIFVPFAKEKWKEVTKIYNSNPDFLQHHLGVDSVKDDFIANEQKEMSNAGFCTVLIYDCEEQIIGLCDYQMGKETYLSLMMLDNR